MTRRVKRMKDVEILLQIKNDEFIRPPNDRQRNWLLKQVIEEFTQNLTALNILAKRFVPGIADPISITDRTHAPLSDDQIMEDWQMPLMKAMADIVTETHGHVLEVGFGRGIASTMIQERGVKSHTIIECNDSIIARFEAWREQYPQQDIRMQHGLWQDVLGELGRFDAVFFHTYPLTESDFIEQIAESTTFADHFFPHAAAHLIDGGVFTYLSNEIDSLSRPHQRLLFRHFRSIQASVLDSLNIPQDIRDAWWIDSMVVVKAIK